MKNYGHTWQWGKDPEYTIDVYTHWNWWALPLAISWNWYEDPLYNKLCSISIDFLCFNFSIEIWRWNR